MDTPLGRVANLTIAMVKQFAIDTTVCLQG